MHFNYQQWSVFQPHILAEVSTASDLSRKLRESFIHYFSSWSIIYLWIYIRTEKGRMMVLHKTDIGSSKVYLVFLVSTKIWNAVFFKQLVIILLCQTLFPKKRKRKVNSRNGKRLDVSVCITITVMLKYQTTYHVLSGLSSSFQMNLSRKW